MGKIAWVLIAISSASFAFFMDMPQQMFKQGSQIIFPAQEQKPCVCQCLAN
jgi:hypothetical protein